MLIEYTPQEAARLIEIRNEYTPRINELMQKSFAAGISDEERARLTTERAQLALRRNEAVEAFNLQCQQDHFSALGGDPAAILENARQQAPAILESAADELFSCAIPEDAESLKYMAVKVEGAFRLRASFAADLVGDELALHIKALQDNPEASMALRDIIRAAVDQSPFTDGKAPETTTAKPAEHHFKRRPLAALSSYGLLNDKTGYSLIRDDPFTQEINGQIRLIWPVELAPQNRKSVPVYMSLMYDGEQGKLSKKLEAFDKEVYNAISSQFHYWYLASSGQPLYITPQEIYRIMNGKQGKQAAAKKASAAQLKRICRSIDKMRHIDFEMDISEEINARYITINDERVVSGKVKDYFLNCTQVSFTTDRGNLVTGYRINTEPIFYTYQAAKKHVIYVDFKLLDTAEALSDGENVAEFKGYLLLQIALMQKGIRNNRRIKLSTLYRDTGILPPEERITGAYANENIRQREIRRIRMADKGKIEKLLTLWAAKYGWIMGFQALNSKGQPVKERQTVDSYEILL